MVGSATSGAQSTGFIRSAETSQGNVKKIVFTKSPLRNSSIHDWKENLDGPPRGRRLASHWLTVVGPQAAEWKLSVVCRPAAARAAHKRGAGGWEGALPAPMLSVTCRKDGYT